MRLVFVAVGLLMVALGIIGAFLPVMPTTVFLIAAAWCFARSSRRLEAWLLGHPRFGPTLKAWREHGAIPRRAKILACAGMTVGYVWFYIGAKPNLPLALIVAVFMAASAVYVTTRPKPPESQI